MTAAQLLLLVETILLVTGFLYLVQWLSQKADEPRMIENAIPFVGPVIQMLQHKSQFHLRMRSKHGLPAHTLRLPGIRIYVLNTLSLIAAAQKQHHMLSFGPIMGQAIGKIAGTSDAANGLMTKDMVTVNGFLLGFNKAIYHTMALGPSLDTLVRRAAFTFVHHIDGLKPTTGKALPLCLSAWTRSVLLQGTTDAIYGKQNPFHDPAIESAWYAFEPGVTTLAMKLIPSFATRKTRQAREVLVQSFATYFSAGCPEDASDFMKARYNHIVDNQIADVQDIARLEVAGAFSIITNSAPTAFWLMYHIFSDPAALEDCRRELSLLVHEREGVCYIDVGTIKASCPTLHSTFHEVMRYYGVAQSIRVVLEDHKLNDALLLRKDSMVMMPATVQHFDPSAWGSDVNQFAYKRFMKPISEGNEPNFDAKTSNRGAFRGFGGGLHLCPGRHFAVAEILSLVAISILRFDIVPAGGKQWPSLRRETLSSKGSAIIMPDLDLDVMMYPREDKKWIISPTTLL